MVAPVAPNPYFIVAPSLYRHSHVSLSRHLAVRTTPLFDSPGCGTPHASHSLAFSYSAPLAQWSWETALRSRHEAHLARFGHGHCFILIRSRPCALPLSQRGVAETRHCFALNSSLLPGSFSAGLRRTTRKHSLATPMSDFFVSRGARWNGPSHFPFILCARPTAVHLVCIAVGAAHAPTTSSHLLCSGSLQRGARLVPSKILNPPPYFHHRPTPRLTTMGLAPRELRAILEKVS